MLWSNWWWKQKILSYNWRWDHTPFQNKDQHANMPTCKQVKQDIFKGQTVLHRTRNTINSICEKPHVLVLCQRNNLCKTNKKQVRNNKKQVRNKWETLRNKETSQKLTLILCFMCFNMVGHSHRSKLHTALAIVRRRPCSVMLCFYKTTTKTFFHAKHHRQGRKLWSCMQGNIFHIPS